MSADTVNATVTPNGSDTPEVTGTPADTLRAAATYLADYGWHQGDLYADLTVSCPAADVTGAIRAVVYGYPNPATTLDGRLGWHVDMAIATLADSFDIPGPDLTLLGWLEYAGHAVTAWNDDLNQNRDVVIATMQAAADQYDADARQHARGGAR
jgi:hypothetical protein